MHCPTSNTFIGSGLFDMAGLMAEGQRIGLATDTGGGSSFSMLRTMRYSRGIPIFLPLMSPVSIASKFGTARSALVLSLGSWPHIASSIIAASRTDLVIGPA